MIRASLRFLSVIASIGLPVLVFADVPPGRYTITGAGTAAGTVYDKKTKLTWQQGAPDTGHNWEGAKTYCSRDVGAVLGGSGWRLPTVKELLSIVDYSRVNPALDPTVFTLYGDHYYWSSSQTAGGNAAWLVFFEDGTASPEGTSSSSYPYAVRCVR